MTAQFKAYFKQLIADTMYMISEDIDEQELFSNYGLESTTLVKLLTKINSTYHIDIKLQDILTRQTFAESYQFIQNHITEKTPVLQHE